MIVDVHWPQPTPITFESIALGGFFAVGDHSLYVKTSLTKALNVQTRQWHDFDNGRVLAGRVATLAVKMETR